MIEELSLPHKDSRKIIKLGNSYAVTIPKNWAEYFGIREKDTVQVISNSVVTIKPPKTARNSKCKNEYFKSPFPIDGSFNMYSRT